MKRKGLLILALIFALSLFTACGDGGDEGSSGGNFQDPYEAYKLPHDDDRFAITEAITEKPPKAVLLKPLFYERAYYETVAINGAEVVLEKGKSINIGFEENLIHDSGESYPIQSNIVLKYDGKADEDLFHADTNTYGNPTLVIDGLWISDYKQHNVKDTVARFEFIEEGDYHDYNYHGPISLALAVRLGVDQGEATQADGNIGYIYYQVVGVKR